VKGALFMAAGILLAMQGGIDEIRLRGKGRPIWPAGLAMALGGVLLGGAPVGLMDEGAHLIDEAGSGADAAFAMLAVIAGAALTGGAVLRASGRIFLGWGEVPGEEAEAPTEQEQEDSGRPLWLMLAPCALLLALALFSGEQAGKLMHQAIGGFTQRPLRPLPHPGHPLVPWLSLALSFGIAGFDLGRRHLPRALTAASEFVSEPLFRVLHRLHDGIIGDYVAWIAAGLALFVAVLALG
jgi:multicomponent Na+:H+ antiporter subunit D